MFHNELMWHCSSTYRRNNVDMNSWFHHDTILVDKHVVVDLVVHIHSQEDMQYKIFVRNLLHMYSMDTMSNVNPVTMNTFLDDRG